MALLYSGAMDPENENQRKEVMASAKTFKGILGKGRHTPEAWEAVQDMPWGSKYVNTTYFGS